MDRFTGKSIKRLEDPRALCGQNCYVDDMKFPDQAYLGMARSNYAHARLRSIDTSQALRQSGIFAIYTANQLARFVKPIPPVSSPPGQKTRDLMPFALGKVRYVGEPVAVVVGESRENVEDALDSIVVDYEPLKAVVDTEEALASGTIINEEWGDNVAYHFELHGGDVESGFRHADALIGGRFKIQRYSGASLEPRAVAASYDPYRDYLNVWSSTQWPHVLRTFIAMALGMPENRIHTVAPDVGGGFGNKEDVYPEDILVPLLSRLLRRPIKWAATRSEDLRTTVHSREQVHHLELAGSSNGRILGLKDRIIADIGAFHILSTGPPIVSALHMPGPYAIPNVSVSLDCVTTNKTPEGAYRGFGMVEATFVLERGIDLLAEEIGKDPAEVRLLNVPNPESFPFKTVTGAVYDSGDYPECMHKLLEISRYSELLKAREAALSKGKVLGVGLSFYNEAGSFAPARLMHTETGSRYYSGWDYTTVRITPTGKVLVLLGVSAHGQGHDTTFAQVCADELQIDIQDVTVLHGDSNVSPYGFGTWGTRSTVACASMINAIRRLREKMKRIASHMMGVGAEDVAFDEGRFRSIRLSTSVTVAEVARRAYDGHPLPVGVEPGLEETSAYDPPGLTYCYAAHLAQVELDRETGHVTLEKYFIVHDCGKVINPAIVEGQIIGSLAQGIGGALLEEFKYDKDGQLLSTTFMDYLLPQSSDMPKSLVIEHMITPSPYNNGYKGMSEGGCIGAPSAIANAVDDALRQIGAGPVSFTPLTDENVWMLTKIARFGAGANVKKRLIRSLRG